MAMHYNTKIPTSGLIACLDAANPKSYPGTGTVWTDLSSNGNDGAFTGTITFTTDGGTPILSCPGTTGNYINISGLALTTGTSTIVCGTRKPGADSGRVVSGLSNNWLLGHHGTSDDKYYASGWVNNPVIADSLTWQTYAGTADVTGDLYSFYVNGAAVVTDATTGAAGPNGITVGRYGPGDTEYSACYISFLLAYNRVLTADEVKQIHEAYRGRFGI